MLGGNVLLLVVDLVIEVINMRSLWHLNLSMLCNSSCHLFVDLLHSKLQVSWSCATRLEDSSSVLISVSGVPKGPGFAEEIFFQIVVPVFVFTVEFKVVVLSHAVDSQDPILIIRTHILHGSHSSRNHLLKVVDLINVFLLTPEAVWTSDEDQVFFSVVAHFGNVVKVHAVHQGHEDSDIHCMSWPDNGPLGTVLHCHVVVVITISMAFKIPA